MAGSELARIKHTTKVVPPSRQRRTTTRSRAVIDAETRPVEKKPEKRTVERPKKQKVEVTHQRKRDRAAFINNGSNTVKIEFLIGLALLVLSPLGNPSIQPDRDYVKRVVSWILVFMMLFPMSGSSRPGLVRLANGMGAVILLVISIKGTRSGFGVDVPALINTIVAKIQPGGDLGIPTPPPGVTVPIPGEPGGTLTGPGNGQQWTVGVGGDFTTPNIGHRGRFVE